MTQTLPIAYAKEILEQQKARGGNSELLLEKAGMTVEDFHRSEISLQQYGILHAVASRETADEFLGFQSRGAVPPGTFRMTCIVMLHTQNLQMALERGAEFLKLAQGLSLVPVCKEDGDCLIVDRAPPGYLKRRQLESTIENVPPLIMLRGMLAWFHLACWLAGRRLKVHKVQLSCSRDSGTISCSRDSGTNSFEDAFQAPIEYGCESDRVHYDLSDLQTPVVQDEKSLGVFLKACPSPLMFAASETRSVSERVRVLLGRDFSRPQPLAEEVASQLGMSVSTLHRNLKSDGLTYQKIKDECRMQACISYLAQPDLKMADIAAMTGFEETRSFFRSFKRWVGMTPSEFRNQIIVGKGVDNQYACKTSDRKCHLY